MRLVIFIAIIFSALSSLQADQHKLSLKFSQNPEGRLHAEFIGNAFSKNFEFRSFTSNITGTLTISHISLPSPIILTVKKGETQEINRLLPTRMNFGFLILGFTVDSTDVTKEGTFDIGTIDGSKLEFPFLVKNTVSQNVQGHHKHILNLEFRQDENKQLHARFLGNAKGEIFHFHTFTSRIDGEITFSHIEVPSFTLQVQKGQTYDIHQNFPTFQNFGFLILQIKVNSQEVKNPGTFEIGTITGSKLELFRLTSVQWLQAHNGGLEEAFRQADKQQKPVLAFFSFGLQGDTEEIKNNILSKPKFAKLAKNFILVEVDFNWFINHKHFFEFKAKNPSFLFLDKDRNEIHSRLENNITSKTLFAAMKKISQ